MTPGTGSGRGRSAATWLRELRRAVSWHRRLLAAGLLAGSVAMSISVFAPDPPPTVGVLSAARELPGGTALRADHVRVTRVSPDTVPAGALVRQEQVRGRVVASPVRQGEVLTDVRLVGRSLLASYGSDVVAVPIRIADAATTRLLRTGDVIDVLAAAAPEVADGDTPAAARVVASAVSVLTLLRETRGGFASGGIDGGALVVVATNAETAARLASAAVTSRLSVTIRRG